MKKKYISEIITEYFAGRYPHETERKVQNWLIDENHSEEKEYFLQEYWNNIPLEESSDVSGSLAEVRKKIIIPETVKIIPMRRRFLRIAVVLLPFILIAGYVFWSQGMIGGSMAKVTVPYGKKTEVILPDGSTVWLNAGSTLRYPKEFDADTRIVELQGEAYFSVAKNERHPFIVETKNISVKVLGTEFNVTAYPEDENTVTTLNSGRVEINTATGKTLLAPDQQCTFNNRTAETIVADVPADIFCEWREGRLVFEGESLKDILHRLERTYNVSFVINEAILDQNKKLSVKFVNDENIEQIMYVLKDIGDFSYQIQKKKIIITN